MCEVLDGTSTARGTNAAMRGGTMKTTSPIRSILFATLATLGLQACAVDDTGRPSVDRAVEVSDDTLSSDQIVLELRDGVTHHISGAAEADRISLSDGELEIPLVDLLSGLELHTWTHVDITTRLDTDGNWRILVAPGTQLTRLSRYPICLEWVTVIQWRDGKMTMHLICKTEVYV